MAVQLRPSKRPDNQDSLDLLQALIDTPPSPADARLAPVALRSTDEHRDYALRGFRRRTWVDRALRYAELGLVLAALGFFGYWFADGPLRDYLHERQQANAPALAPVAEAAPAAPAETQADAAASWLPFTTPDMAAPPTDEFLAPRQSVGTDAVVVSQEPTRLLIPGIELDTPIKEVFVVDGAWEVADYAAGYMHGTALPGDNGNTVLSGHAGLRGAVFGSLNRLAAGDDVYLDAGGWRYHYRVRASENVWPNQVEVLESNGVPVLTLITCTNWDTQRLVVVADLLDSKPSPGA